MNTDNAPAAHETTIYIAQSETEKSVQKKGSEIIKQTIRLGKSYMELAILIHDGNVGPKTVRQLLEPLGFKRTRISEINTIANAPHDRWEAILAAGLGYKHAIDMARGGKAEEILALETDQTPEELNRRLHREAVDIESDVKEPAPAPQNPRERIKTLLAKACNLADAAKIKQIKIAVTTLNETFDVSIKRRKSATAKKQPA